MKNTLRAERWGEFEISMRRIPVAQRGKVIPPILGHRGRGLQILSVKRFDKVEISDRRQRELRIHSHCTPAVSLYWPARTTAFIQSPNLCIPKPQDSFLIHNTSTTSSTQHSGATNTPPLAG